ncbi:MAG: hypothetical protein LUE26_09395, partial [Alistipes sp.]|nr:hypothetical protein [Alistipes sp.]
MKWITTRDILHWVETNQRQAQEMMPEILRRLIRASITQIFTLTFPSGDNIQLGGWDGIINTNESNEFIPEGCSGWEIGTSKGVRGKADLDYEKRKKDPLGLNPQETTYIFITPRIWTRANRWIEERKKENFWKDIKVITAEELEEWLENTPSVAAWVSSEIIKNYPDNSLDTTDAFWDKWSRNKTHSLDPDVILSGRVNEKNALTDSLRTNDIFFIKSLSKQESTAFIIASFITSDECREDFFARSLIVSTTDAFRQLSCSQTPLILIPSFEDEGNFNQAVLNGHTVFVPLGISDYKISGNLIELPEIDRDGFVEALKKSGYKNAEQLSKECIRNISVLRRSLEYDYSTPLWASKDHCRDIIPAILIGRWRDCYEGDKKAIQKLSKLAYEDHIDQITKWSLSDDAPIIHIDDYWRVTSPLDAFLHSMKFFTSKDIQNLQEIAIDVFSEVDENIEEKEKINGFFFQQDKRTYSYRIREGVIHTLILISILGDQIKNPNIKNPVVWVDSIIREILSSDNEYLWKSIDKLLPLIAEASPSEFLNAVEKLIRSQSHIPKSLLTLGSKINPIYGRGSYHGIIWALESISWDPKYLSRASLALLSFIQYKDDNGTSKALNSLKEIHRAWHHQTFASIDERIEVLRLLITQNREKGWELLVALIPKMDSETGMDTHTMRWRFYGKIKLNQFNIYERQRTYDEIISMLLETTNNSITEILDLLEISTSPATTDPKRNEILDHIEKNINAIDDTENLLWNQLRTEIHHNREYPDAEWSMNEEQLLPYLRLYDKLKPQNPIALVKWMFDRHSLEDVNPVPNQDYKEKGWRSFSIRIEAIKNLTKDYGYETIFKMSTEVKESNILGQAFGEIVLNDESLKEQVLRSVDLNEVNENFLRSFFWRLLNSKTFEEVIFIYKSLPNSLSKKVRVIFFLSLNETIRLWNFLEGLEPEIISEYWDGIRFYDGTNEEINYAILKLSERRRFSCCIDICRHVPDKISTDNIKNILYGCFSQNKEPLPNSYKIEEILDELYKRDDIGNEELANLELMCVPLLDLSKYTPHKLFEELVTNPVSYIEIIKMIIYRPDEIYEESEDLSKLKFRKGYAIIDNLNILPGTDKEGKIDPNKLHSWIDKVLVASEQIEKRSYVECQIGKLLGNFIVKNKFELTELICITIEKYKSDSLIEG